MWRDKNARTDMENAGIEESVGQLAWALYRRPLVMLFETDPSGAIVRHGSGTLVRAASGRAVILTAAHVVDGARRMDLLLEEGVVSNVIAEVRTMWPTVDVSVVVCREGCLGLDELALNPDLIADGRDAEVKKGDTVDVIGFPEQVVVDVPDPKVGRRQLHGDMIHRTNIAGCDRNAISIIWQEGDILDGSTQIYEAAGFAVGSRVPQRKPCGISGGAVWKTLPVRNEIWSPEKVFRMIAIPHEYKDQKQLAIPSSRWLPWLRAQLAGL